MALVSIVVPVFNVEDYLAVCLDSIINQTLKDIEIIIVDDGSTDRSAEICDLYLRDPRVRVIHQKNGGLSAARNTGIREAASEYIGFVDSDDYIRPEMYELMYQAITGQHAGICAVGFERDSDGDIRPYLSETGKLMTYTAEEAIRDTMLNRHISVYAWAKLYHRSVFENDPAPFPPGKVYEDMASFIKFYSKAGKILYLGRNLYVYRLRKGSITYGPYCARWEADRLDICRDIIKKTESDYPAIRYEAVSYAVNMAVLSSIGRMYMHQVENREMIGLMKAVIRENRQHVFRNPYISLAKKLAARLLLISWPCYRFLFRLYIPLAAFLRSRKEEAYGRP